MLLRLRLAGLLATAGLMLSAGAAQATVTSSNITSPANGAYLQSLDDPPSPTMLTVTGTSNGTTGDLVRVRCWYDDNSSSTLASGVAVNADGTFSVTAHLSHIGGRDCRLRAEPNSFSSESAAFAGPRIAVSEYSTTGFSNDVIQGGPNAGDLLSYYANGTTFGSYAGWDSAGSCGPYLQSIDSSYELSGYGLDCVGSLFDSDGISRSEIQVDGKNAYDPVGAEDLFNGACCTRSQDNSGFPALTVSQSWNSSNGFESTTEADGIAECTGADGYLPPNQAACPSFQDAGVKLQRAISMISPYQIMMTDTWSSTDGHAHTVDAEYDDDIDSNGSGTGFQFPGESGFSRRAPGDVLAGAASAPGSIFVHTDIGALDGDPSNQYGAITFGNAPSGFVFYANSEFIEHQTLSVPAGGSATLTYIYSTGFTFEQVQALALAAQDHFKSPAVSISSPANDTTVKTGAVAVSGIATAGSGIKSLTVAGHAVTVGANGAWATTVTLGKGANTITATATDNAGLTASANITVIYAQTCTVPLVKGLSRSKAEKQIRAAGCLIDKIKKKHSKVKKGDAIGTKPGAGRVVAAGTKVKLIVSEGRSR